MKTLVTIFHCLLAWCFVASAETNATPQVQFVDLTGKVLRHEIALSDISKLPSSAEITNVLIGPKMNGEQLTQAEFLKRLDDAKPIKPDDRRILTSDYVRWILVAFDTKAGRFYANLNLGWSFLQFPDGRVVAIAFNANQDPLNESQPTKFYPYILLGRVPGQTDGLPEPTNGMIRQIEISQAAAITNGITLGQLVASLGPGYVDNFSGLGNIMWPVTDGRVLCVRGSRASDILSSNANSSQRFWFITPDPNVHRLLFETNALSLN